MCSAGFGNDDGRRQRRASSARLFPLRAAGTKPTMAETDARRTRTALVVALGVLIVVAAVAVYTFRNVGCFPGVDDRKAAQYAECLREGRQTGRAALAALAVGAALVVIGAIRLIGQRR
jgi:hypothetical protein